MTQIVFSRHKNETKYQLQSLHKLVHPANIGLAGISVEIASFFGQGSIALYIINKNL